MCNALCFFMCIAMITIMTVKKRPYSNTHKHTCMENVVELCVYDLEKYDQKLCTRNAFFTLV